MAKFTRRHYEAIANVLDTLGGQPSHFDIVAAFAGMLAKDSPKFKDSLFFFAAGEPEHAAILKTAKKQLKKVATA